MGAVGTSADNAACENSHDTPKRETLRGVHHYPGAELCRRTFFRWLTRYNTRRRHSARAARPGVGAAGYPGSRPASNSAVPSGDSTWKWWLPRSTGTMRIRSP